MNNRPTLPNALRDWQSECFAKTLKQEIEGLQAGSLPLMDGVSQGGVPDDASVSVSLLKTVEAPSSIHADLGVFFTEVLAGCNCGDEPMAMHGYCEMQVSIDKTTAEAVFQVKAE
ncbi:MAG: glucosamine--fructose-6-phosphate aminotransferase [Gammaproteobacteria bacterium]|nr:glucosamine--fructose-6-phosphate aminotransferase [Gammaproteobacteria bacterium]